MFIGHNIFHVYDISDRFVVLDRGEVVHRLNKSEISSPEKLMKIMKDTISKPLGYIMDKSQSYLRNYFHKNGRAFGSMGYFILLMLVF